MTLHTCPCCGYKTLPEMPPGTFEICKICYWEDDAVQFEYPYESGGANGVSLYQAQRNYQMFGASESLFVDSVTKPTAKDVKDPNFQIVAPLKRDPIF